MESKAYSGAQPIQPQTEEANTDVRAINQLNWWAKSKRPNTFPYTTVLSAYRNDGKHFASEKIRSKLKYIQRELEDCTDQKYEDILMFLEVLLDKHDGYYDYQSYLALTLIDIPDEDTLVVEPRDPQQHLDRRMILLCADIAQFEIEAFAGVTNWLPKRPASQELMQIRCKRIIKALIPYLVRQKLEYLVDLENPVESATALCQVILSSTKSREKLFLQISNVPVYLVHDEYMFIRILQCFETVFAWVRAQLKLAVEIFEKDIAAAIRCLDASRAYLHDAAPLFHVLSTLDKESFKEFRTFTEGASAIQSRSYKRVESLCATPTDSRLNSIAYMSVPEVREHVLAGQATIDDLRRKVEMDGTVDSGFMRDMSAAMSGFQDTLVRWRQSHYGIAVKMLGKSPGTGYTEGTPYLNDTRNLSVFPSIEVANPGAAN
jgi:tryptophan 2,3-dioxygenase